METNTYNKLANKEVTKVYKNNKRTNINSHKDAKHVAIKLKLHKKIKQLAKVELFMAICIIVQIKLDACCEIPQKCNLGKIIKHVLSKMFKAKE